MSGPVRERLYALLPAVYRLRDAEQGSPLRALLAVVDRQVAALEADTARLYDNWFVETCDEWVVPYLADLLGVQGLNPAAARTYSQRAYVANVLSYRRRKGTAAMLEQLAQDLTDWPAHAVEFFQLLSTTQHLNHLRPANLRTPDLREGGPLGLLGGPFEEAAHTVEVRRATSGRGRYNIQNVGLFLWRLASHPIVRADATVATDAAQPGFFRFSPLGQDLPLFNRRRLTEDVSRLSTEESVPGPLRRRALFDDLAAFQDVRARLGAKAPPDSLYFGTRPDLALAVGGLDLPVEALLICDMEEWHRPPDVTPTPGKWPAGSVAVDPLLGRIAFAKSVAPSAPPQTSYYQGWPGPLGGGGYPRPEALPAPASPAAVSGGGAALTNRLAAISYAPVTAAEQQKRIDPLRGSSAREPLGGTRRPVSDRLGALLGVAGQSCIVEIADSATYQLSSIDVPAASVLEIRAADGERPLIQLTAPAMVTIGKEGVLILNGLLLAGKTLAVDKAPEAGLLLQHSTLVPGLSLSPDGTPQSPDALSVDGPAGPGRFDLLLYRSIAGPLRLQGEDGYLYLEDSIADAAAGALPALSDPRGHRARDHPGRRAGRGL